LKPWLAEELPRDMEDRSGMAGVVRDGRDPRRAILWTDGDRSGNQLGSDRDSSVGGHDVPYRPLGVRICWNGPKLDLGGAACASNYIHHQPGKRVAAPGRDGVGERRDKIQNATVAYEAPSRIHGPIEKGRAGGERSVGRHAREAEGGWIVFDPEREA